jgi:putative sigma-54 modulation protein
MQITVTGQNIKVTPALKSHAEEKLQHLEKRFSEITNIHLVLRIEHIDHIAEATLHYHGSEMHASAQDKDMYAAIDMLIDKLNGQINKQKEKEIDAVRHPHD